MRLFTRRTRRIQRAQSTNLRVEGSASTAHLGFPVKVVNAKGTCITRCTDEAHAHRVIASFEAILKSPSGQHALRCHG